MKFLCLQQIQTREAQISSKGRPNWERTQDKINLVPTAFFPQSQLHILWTLNFSGVLRCVIWSCKKQTSTPSQTEVNWLLHFPTSYIGFIYMWSKIDPTKCCGDFQVMEESILAHSRKTRKWFPHWLLILSFSSLYSWQYRLDPIFQQRGKRELGKSSAPRKRPMA